MTLPSKPTVSKPEWATDAGAIKLEPPTVKKETGWELVPSTTKGEKPILNYTNWNNFVTGEWVAWLESAADQLDSDVTALTGVVATKEDDLGNPAESGSILSSTDVGVRSWRPVGTDIGDLIELEDVGGNASLPAVDGSQLTGLSSGATTLNGLTDCSTAGGVQGDLLQRNGGGIYTTTPAATIIGRKRQNLNAPVFDYLIKEQLLSVVNAFHTPNTVIGFNTLYTVPSGRYAIINLNARRLSNVDRLLLRRVGGSGDAAVITNSNFYASVANIDGNAINSDPSFIDTIVLKAGESIVSQRFVGSGIFNASATAYEYSTVNSVYSDIGLFYEDNNSNSALYTVPANRIAKVIAFTNSLSGGNVVVRKGGVEQNLSPLRALQDLGANTFSNVTWCRSSGVVILNPGDAIVGKNTTGKVTIMGEEIDPSLL
jgi:hypothetical protein